jgi:hypothetical protein
MMRFPGPLTPAIAGVLLACTATVPPPNPGRSRADLERRKLELEVARLEHPSREIPQWLTAALGVWVGVLSSFVVARRARLGALDQAVHDKRLECYPQLVRATSPLALYFPGSNSDTPSLTPDICRQMGRDMSRWYFQGGGLLLSRRSRDAYFHFARALTRASMAEALDAPTFPRDADDISLASMKIYRRQLKAKQVDLKNIESWTYGHSEGMPPADPRLRFKDYVFLQNLSSSIRTSLAKDLRGRRRPS